MKNNSITNNTFKYILMMIITLVVFVLCVGIGSVNIPFADTLEVISDAIFGLDVQSDLDTAYAIIVPIRIPRVLCVALIGAALALSGAAMQGLLKNPLADGSTLGVSSGASLGAVIAIAFGITIPSLPFTGTMILSIVFAFLSMVIILSLAKKIDYALTTNTVILVGVIFSMFATSIVSLITVMASSKVKQIVFWTMGSLAGSTYLNAIFLLVALIICGNIILHKASELNAFAISEENARTIGVDVRKTRLIIMICVSVLIGVCVAIGGTIAFVGLVTPHIVRLTVGPNHKKLLSVSLFAGATFLMLSDLVARTIISPAELPIGVITSFVGAIVFIIVFYQSRKVK